MADSKRTHRHGMYRLYAPIYDRFMAPSFADGHSKMYNSLDLKKGDNLFIMEVMKTEVHHDSPIDGKVIKVNVVN